MLFRPKSLRINHSSAYRMREWTLAKWLRTSIRKVATDSNGFRLLSVILFHLIKSNIVYVMCPESEPDSIFSTVMLCYSLPYRFKQNPSKYYRKNIHEIHNEAVDTMWIKLISTLAITLSLRLHHNRQHPRHHLRLFRGKNRCVINATFVISGRKCNFHLLQTTSKFSMKIKQRLFASCYLS